MSPGTHGNRRSPLPWILVFVLVSLLAPRVSLAGGSPAKPVKQTLWGDLEPVDPSPLPKNRDSTAFNEFREKYSDYPWFMSLDIANGYIIMGLSHGVEIWDARTDPTAPAFISKTAYSIIPVRAIGEAKWPMNDIAVPPGDDGVAAQVGDFTTGLIVWNLTNKVKPSIHYQQPGDGYSEVWAGNLAGREYAFVAAGGPGLQVYDLTAARELTLCVDNASGSKCPGVYLGDSLRVGSKLGLQYVDGTGHYVAASSGSGRGLQVWDVANPRSPVLKLSALDDLPADGVSIWQQGSRYYLAIVTSTFVAGVGNVYEGRIYDVTCITSSCTGIGSPIWSGRVGQPSSHSYITYSESNGTPFLYFGNDNRTTGGLQREFLFDVTNPRSPVDLSPKRTETVSGTPIDYWGWYYGGNPTGFNNVGPRRGMFLGQYFYRAGWSIFDIHKRAGGFPPVAGFAYSPSEIYPGTPVDFTDLSTGAPDTWDWSFAGGTPASSSQQNPSGVTFSTVGTGHFVSLKASNSVGSNTKTLSITVLDPAPAIGTVTANVSQASVCQAVTFTADGVTGRPPLTYGWRILDDQSQPVVGPVSASSSYVWDVDPSLAPGSYLAELTVSNTEPTSAVKLSAPVTISALDPLAFTGPSGAPEADAFSTATVQFHLQATGATEWSWDFGDGAGFTPYTSDPVAGPNPVHTYTTTGAKNVRVRIRNCQAPEILSNALQIEIVNVTPLIAKFQARSCLGGAGCAAFVGLPVTFDDLSSGAEVWDYDWDGDGTYEDAGHTSPVTQHTYTKTGSFRPRLQVRRGSEVSDPYIHATIVVSTQSTPPPPPPTKSISVTGPFSGTIGAALTFQASAIGCTPMAGGWSWDTAGGSGSSTSNQITITWDTAGTKSISVVNTGCGLTVGRKNLVISDPDGGGGGGGGGGGSTSLKAAFTFNPSTPVAGAPVSFDGSSSEGSPTTWVWDFGDGGKSVDSTQSTISHTFSAAGTYKVKLSVSKLDPGKGCFLNICVATTVKSVTVDEGNQTPPGLCPDDPNALCLAGGRFKVTVDWTNQHATKPADETGMGHPIPGLSDISGYFWFFDSNAVDLIVKLLDGRDINGSFWVFYGGLSDVNYRIHVHDQETGDSRTYENLAGNICGLGDLEAFPQTSGGNNNSQVTGSQARRNPYQAAEALPTAFSTARAGTLLPFPGAGEAPQASGACVPDDETLCLLDGRFQARVNWTNQHKDGETGIGTAIAGTDSTGFFWFFDPANIELVVKMLDGRTINGGIWVFFGALSDVEYDLEITDTETNATKSYHNKPGNICGLGDIHAF